MKLRESNREHERIWREGKDMKEMLQLYYHEKES